MNNTTPRIAVTATKFIKGRNHPAEQTELLEIVPLREALEREWPTDAHCVQYTLPAPATAQPRLNKPCLAHLPAETMPAVWALFLDYDNAGKAEWTDATLATFAEQLDGLPPFFACYTTQHGARVIYALTQSVTPDCAEELLAGMLDAFTAKGLAFDPACKDWTRLFRLPKVLRDGRRTEASRLFVLDIPGHLTDPATLTAKPKPAPAPPGEPVPVPEGGHPYALAILRDEVAKVAAAAQGERNHAANRAAFAVGQWAGYLPSAKAAKDALLDAATTCGLTEAEAFRTIASGFEAGALKPKHPPAQDGVFPSLLPLRPAELPELPDGILPPWARDYVAALCQAKEVSPTFGIPIALAALAGALQRQYIVRVEGSYSEPLALFAAPAMEPGERKTAIHRPLLAPLHDLQKELREENEAKEQDARIIRRLAEKRIAQLENEAAKAKDAHERKNIAAQVAQVEAEKPPEAWPPQLLMGSFSEPVLCQNLSRNGGCMLVESDEGGLFEELAGRFSDGGPEIELILKAHAGSPYTSSRIARGEHLLSRPLVSIAISPQPDCLMTLGKQPGFIGRGLLARFMWALPASKVGGRTLNPAQVPDGLRIKYHAALAILARQAWHWRGEPVEITLTPEAHALWKAFEREIEPRMKKGTGDLIGPVKPWASKLPGLVARVAALAHAAGNPRPNEPLPAERMAHAVAFGRALIPHAVEVHRLFFGNSTNTAAAVVNHYNAAGWPKGAQALTELWRPVRHLFGDKPTSMQPVAEQLEAHGYLIPAERPTGTRKGQFWVAHPDLTNPEIRKS